MLGAAENRADDEQDHRIIGRYALFDALASGGMATVHLGRLLGEVGFSRTVAVKCLHAHYTSDQEFVAMFMDEARIVARIRHPNVVPMVDVIESRRGLFLVMEYVHGESLSKLLRTCRAAKESIPIKVVTAIVHGVLLGLHAAHETKGTNGELLEVVHRDVSPQNVIVGSDGVARVLDFGVAKAAGRAQVTLEGQIKGKLAYMAPEHIRGIVDRRADVFAAAVMLWEALAGRRLHEGASDVEIVTRVVKGDFSPPSEHRPDIPAELDAIVMRGLTVDLDQRYPDAREMALDIERKVGLSSQSEVGEWVERLAPDVLRERADKVAAMEKASRLLTPRESFPPSSLPLVMGANLDDPMAVPVHEDESEMSEDISSSVTAGGPHSSSTISTSSTRTPGATAIPVPLPPAARTPHSTTFVALATFIPVLLMVGVVVAVLAIRSEPASTSHTAAPSPVEPTVAEPNPSASAAAPTLVARSASVAPSAKAAPHPTIGLGGAAPGAMSPRPNTAGGRPLPTPSAAQPSPSPSKNNCDPPFILDENGHKKYKLECLSEN